MTIPLDDPMASDVRVSGGKAAGLAPFVGRFPVPAAFVLSIVDPHLIDAIAAGTVPRTVRAAIAAALPRLGPGPVAVRSSGVSEDGRATAHAGRYTSVLNVQGVAAVCRAVGTVLRSIREAHPDASRGKAAEPIPVLIQALVPADAAAVVFSRDPREPATARSDLALVQAIWGLGDALVGGRTIPDTYRVARGSGTIVASHLGAKALMSIPAPGGGIRDVPVPRRLRTRSVLHASQVAALTRLAVRLEDEAGWPVDVEAAWADDRWYVLQCRPITTGPGRLAAPGPSEGEQP